VSAGAVVTVLVKTDAIKFPNPSSVSTAKTSLDLLPTPRCLYGTSMNFSGIFSLVLAATTGGTEPTIQQINQLFGVPLWTTECLWDEQAAVVASRLGCRPESAAGDKASYLARTHQEILGAPIESLRVSARGGKVDSIMIVYANKGDSVGLKPEHKHFKNSTDYNKALLAYEKALSLFPQRIQRDAATLEKNLTALLGASKNQRFGEGGAVSEIVKQWQWRDHAILLSEQPRESLSLRIVPPAQAGARAERISDADLKKELKDRVQRRPNGDVVVTGIPMVDQGRKGYCVPATWSRYLQYMGIPVDEYALANAADTRAGSGTFTRAMVTAVQPAVARNRRQLVSFKGAPNLPMLEKYIDQGLPLMWTMCSVGPFEGTGRPPNRMDNLSLEDWLKALKPFRANAYKLNRNENFHMCMIIGYNKATKEIATSDSWGPEHREKWYTLEEVQRVSRDELFVITW